jgi:hypothetical protein
MLTTILTAAALIRSTIPRKAPKARARLVRWRGSDGHWHWQTVGA